MFNDRLLTVITVILFATGLGLLGRVFYKSYSRPRVQSAAPSVSACVTGVLNQVMDDEYMSGVLEKGQSYQVLKNYYNCNPIQRGDVVWFRISAPIQPVVKMVYGVPGDRFEVVKSPKADKRWEVKINDQWVEGKNGRLFIEAEYTPPLKTYEISRQGLLRDGEYIIFSNISPGLSDSSNLGLVRRRSFEGKVVQPGS